jgi:hypothetical protein
MTNQYIDQLPLTVRQAIFGNVGTMGSFVVSPADAAILEKEFAPVVSADDLVSLDAWAMYVKLCVDGMTSVPFSAKSLPVRYNHFGLKDEIVAHSREEYGTPREVIEEKISKWSNQEYSDKGNRSIIKDNNDEKPKDQKESNKQGEKKDGENKSKSLKK